MKEKVSVDDLQSFFTACLEKIVNGEKFKATIKEAAKQAFKEMEREKENPRPDLPPVFENVLKEGLLKYVPENGKYTKRPGIKDMAIIKHIVDHSGYADSLTADLYIQYIQVGIKPNSIDQYISRARQEAK